MYRRDNATMCDYVSKDSVQGVMQAGIRQATASDYGATRRPTPLEEMEKQQAYRDQESQVKYEGMAFLRENPTFNTFIDLIRKGALSI